MVDGCHGEGGTLVQKLPKGISLLSPSSLEKLCSRHDVLLSLLPNGVQRRIIQKGKMIRWSPVEGVLSHLSKCRNTEICWNSTEILELPLSSTTSDQSLFWPQLSADLMLANRTVRNSIVFKDKSYLTLNNTVWYIPTWFSFLWSPGQPGFKLTVLQRPWRKGGLACPDLHKYFLTALLSHAHSWLISVESNAAVVLEAACPGSYKALWNLIYRGPGAPFPLTVAMRAVWRACSVANVLRPMPPGHISPLWFNPLLSEFMSIPDPSVWAHKGFEYVDQICTRGQLQTFDGLK